MIKKKKALPPPKDDFALAVSLRGRQEGKPEARAADDVRRYLRLEVFKPDSRQSSVSKMLTCLRMYLLGEIMGLKPRGYKSAPGLGTMFHKIMNLHYLGFNPTNTVRHIESHVEKINEELMEHGKKNGNLQVAEKQCDQVERDAAKALAMADFYQTKWKIPEGLKVVAVEKSFRVQVPEINDEINGTVDLLLYAEKHPKFGTGYIILDHKTTRLDPDTWALALPWALQPRHYRIGIQRALEEGQLGLKAHPVVGFCHNVIMRPGITWKNSQEYDEYLEEIRDWFEGRDDKKGFIDPETGQRAVFKSGPRKGLVKPRWEHADLADRWKEVPPTKQFLTKFTEPLFPEEYLVTMQMYRRAKNAAPTLSNFPKLGEITGVCRNHYGSPCAFLNVCRIPNPAQWAPIIEKEFDVVGPTQEDDE